MALYLGVACEVAATMVGTVGKQLVSYSARVESKSMAKSLKLSGLFVTTLIGPVLDMAAYAFAPQAIIAPLNGLDIVWNTITAPFTLNEKLTRRHVCGAVLVFFGAGMTSYLGPHHDAEATWEWMTNIFMCRRFLVYVLCFTIFVLICALILVNRPKGVGDPLRGFALGSLAGGIAGNMFFVSAGLGLLRRSIATGDWEAWHHWLPYPVLLSAVVVALGNIPFMTKGLQEYEALYMVTMFEGTHITVACLSSDYVLRELEGQTGVRSTLYWVAVNLIVFGLFAIQGASINTLSRKLRLHAQRAHLAIGFARWQPSFGRVAPRDDDDAGKALAQPDMESAEWPAPVSCVASRPLANELARSNSIIVSGSVVWAGGLSGIGSLHLVDPHVDSETEEGSAKAEDDASSAEDGESGAAEQEQE